MGTIIARPIATALVRPVFLTAALGDADRLFILEQHTGAVRIFRPNTGKVDPTPFLVVPGGVSRGNEQGLLGLAFHPDYAANKQFFVNYTDPTGNTHVARFTAASADRADPASGRDLLVVTQPFANHNGGWLGFGPDQMLYASFGDGGSGNDPGNRGQNLGELLGKLLRLDVDARSPGLAYGIPPTNPFVGRPGARGEIWAYGLRNPWRCSFDRQTGDLYIGDVGQGQWEEIDFQPAASTGGENYGWRVREGRHDTGLSPAPAGVRLVEPIHEYDHDTGLAVVGGYVYRGGAIPDLRGAYLFADNTGPVWALRHDGTQATEVRPLQDELFPAGVPASLSSFGEDAAGELYLLSLVPGVVFQIVAGP